MDSPNKMPPCHKCLHHRSSYDPAFPHTCVQFGIKSRMIPAQQVFRATGRHCPSFVKNPKIRD